MAKHLLVWQKYVCHKKCFLGVTKICLSQQNFCCDKYLSQQACVCCDKNDTWTILSRQKLCFVVTNMCLSQKIFVVTKVLSQQKYFVITNIILSWQKFHHNKHTFVATKDMFCHDKHVFVVIKLCHDKNDPCGSSHQGYISTWALLTVGQKATWSDTSHATAALLSSTQNVTILNTKSNYTQYKK